MRKIIAFDIGGTQCKWSVFDDDKEIANGLFITKEKCKDQVLDDIAKIIETHAHGNETYVGISSPTAINIDTGYAYGISGIKGYENFNLYEELGKRIDFKYPIKATNDANAALMGTLAFEATKPNCAVLITLGTGIGGALYLNGALITGKDGFGGEFGYGYVFDNKINLSRDISTLALVTKINEELNENLNGEDIATIYTQNKNIVVQKMVDDWLDKIARFCSFLVYAVNPDALYLGGGVSASDFIIDGIAKRMQREFTTYSVKEIMPIVKRAKDANKAGIYGAKNLWQI